MKNSIFQACADQLGELNTAAALFNEAVDGFRKVAVAHQELTARRAKLVSTGDPESAKQIQELGEINSKLLMIPRRLASADQAVVSSGNALIPYLEAIARAAGDAARAESDQFMEKIVALVAPFSPEVFTLNGRKVNTAEQAARSCSIHSHIRQRAALPENFDNCRLSAIDPGQNEKEQQRQLSIKHQHTADLRAAAAHAAQVVADAIERGTFVAENYSK